MEVKSIENNIPVLYKAPENPSKVDWARINKLYVTVQHNKVKICGHKFHPYNDPRTSCQHCWVTYFQNHGEVTKMCDEIFRNDGPEVLIRLRGERFVKMFKRFMATLAKFKEEQENSSCIQQS